MQVITTAIWTFFCDTTIYDTQCTTSAVLLFLWANKLDMSGEHVTNMTNEMHESAQIQMKRRLDKQCPREEMRERDTNALF